MPRHVSPYIRITDIYKMEIFRLKVIFKTIVCQRKTNYALRFKLPLSKWPLSWQEMQIWNQGVWF